MRQVMVRYRIKAERTAENPAYIARVFEELEREKPAGIRYASFKLEDFAAPFERARSVTSRPIAAALR